jgi:hypothetical protein
MKLEEVVPWGRSLTEYQFDLCVCSHYVEYQSVKYKFNKNYNDYLFGSTGGYFLR